MSLDPTFAPVFWEAWPRLIVAAATLAWAWSSARAANRRLYGPLPWDLDAIAASILVASTLTLPAIALGAVGLLRDWSWAAGVILLTVAMRGWANAWQAPPLRFTARGAPPSLPFSIVLGGYLIGRMAFGLRNPPADWDSLHYHLPMVAYWIQNGTLGVALRNPPVFGAYFPGNGEIIQMWAAWAVGRETLMPWAGIAGLAVLGLALRRLCLIAGVRGPIAEGAALSLAMAPGAMQLTLGTRIDNLLAAWFAAALLFALRYRRSRASVDLTLMLLALGLLAGTKSTGPVYSLFLLGVAFAGRGAWRRIRDLLRCRAGVVAALVLGGFWFARNALATGNPLFPAEVVIGPWTLMGIMSSETLKRTSQIVVWMEGYAGHLTWANLWKFYGASLVVLGAGIPMWLWIWLRARSRRAGHRRGTRRGHWRVLAPLAAACFALFLVAPFSAAYLPASGGRPPALNADNMRLLMPTVVSALPIAAFGLSLLRVPALTGVALAGLSLLVLAARLGHVLPGIAAAAALAWARSAVARLRPIGPRLAPVRAAALVAASGVLALAVAWVEPLRERLSDRVWDGYIDRIHNLTAASIRELRESAAGRPIACAGLDSWWAFYGRDFSGRPVYVPVTLDWNEGSKPYRLAPEPRERSDRARWLENLERSGVVYVVVGPLQGDCDRPLEESVWCEEDSTRFRVRVARNCDIAYHVRAPAALGVQVPQGETPEPRTRPE